MAESKLATQLAEAVGLAAALNQEASKFGALKGNFAADLAFGGDGGGGGGGTTTPAAPGGAARNFSAPGRTLRYGQDAGGSGTVTEDSIDVSAEAERLAELTAACRYFAIPPQVMFAATRDQQDKLLAKFRALGSPGYEAGMATQGGGASAGMGEHGAPTSRLPPDILGGAHGQALAAYTPLATQRSNVQASDGPATVAALGSVVTELKRLNSNVERKPTGIEFRTGGLS